MEKQMLNRQQDKPNIVAIYSRVSTKGKNQTTENQTIILKDYARKMGFEVYRVYEDYESGTTQNRVQFQQMMEHARKRKFDLLLFWSLDRLSREGVLPTIHLLQRLESYGIQYRSYTEAYLDSTGIFKEAIVSLLATLALQEKLRLSQRVKAGLDRSRKLGRIGGRPRISQDKVDEIYTLRSRGYSLRKIAREVGVHHGTVAEYIKK